MQYKKRLIKVIPKPINGAFATNTVVNCGRSMNNTHDACDEAPVDTVEDAKDWVDENHL